MRQGLKTFSNWPTYPQLYVKGELVGGLDIVKVRLGGSFLRCKATIWLNWDFFIHNTQKFLSSDLKDIESLQLERIASIESSHQANTTMDAKLSLSTASLWL